MPTRLLFTLLVSTLLAGTALAQGLHVTVLNTVKSRGRLSGVWGHVAPDGREFALVGDYNGTWVVETTDPKRPIERGYFTAPASKWREITSYENFIYSVSEHHRGIRVLDMTNPARPVDRGYVLTANITHTHSISVDPAAGRLYANGTNQGMVILDVRASPASPKILGTYKSSYVHDAFIRRGRGYVCDIRGGRLVILDVRNPTSLPTIASFQTPGRLTHNCWTTEDDKLLVTTDETGSGVLNVYDITTPAKPVWRGSYAGAPGQICHNAFVLGRVCYMAHNSDGFHACDLANPAKPVQIARYDTSATTSGYNGMWGCYPFQDSGVIYGSDRLNGLFLFQVDCGHMNRFGAPSQPAGAAVPRLAFEGAAPRVGAGALELRITGLRPNAPFALAISGRAVGAYRLLGVTVHIDLGGAVWVRGKADGAGAAAIPAPVPNDARLGGVRIYMQLFAADARASSGFSASRGTWAGICR